MKIRHFYIFYNKKENENEYWTNTLQIGICKMLSACAINHCARAIGCIIECNRESPNWVESARGASNNPQSWVDHRVNSCVPHRDCVFIRLHILVDADTRKQIKTKFYFYHIIILGNKVTHVKLCELNCSVTFFPFEFQCLHKMFSE